MNTGQHQSRDYSKVSILSACLLLLFGIEEGKIEAFFKEKGFSTLAAMSFTTCKENCFKNASADRAVPPLFNFVAAAVASGG